MSHMSKKQFRTSGRKLSRFQRWRGDSPVIGRIHTPNAARAKGLTKTAWRHIVKDERDARN